MSATAEIVTPGANNPELRDALEWVTGDEKQAEDPDVPVYEWLWQAIQGDFNDNRSTGQVAFDAAVSMIPLVDQVCDVRDLIANCRKIKEDSNDTWAWVALALTLIGLFPTLGSLVKGVLKIFFLIIRRAGLDRLLKAVDDAMTWVVTYLRKPQVQKILRELKVDEVFGWLAEKVRQVRGLVNMGNLLAAFDKVINTMRKLLDKVARIPFVGEKAQKTIDMVMEVRRLADEKLRNVLDPVFQIMAAIERRLKAESLIARSAVHGANNVHFRGTLPEASAIPLMRRRQPAWLTKKGQGPRYKAIKMEDNKPLRDYIDRAADGKLSPNDPGFYPRLSDEHVETFNTIRPRKFEGPAKLYRIISPASAGASHCWVSEEVFMKLMDAPDPKAAWRKYLAVWPDWNADGQFVIYEVKKGETLHVWEGIAASQTKEKTVNGVKKDLLPDHYLEGGWDQIVFYPHSPPGKKPYEYMDEMRYYKRRGAGGDLTEQYIDFGQYSKLPEWRKADYEGVRAQVKHPNIRGPFSTGWGMTDFDSQLSDVQLGLPALPGQTTNR